MVIAAATMWGMMSARNAAALPPGKGAAVGLAARATLGMQERTRAIRATMVKVRVGRCKKRVISAKTITPAPTWSVVKNAIEPI